MVLVPFPLICAPIFWRHVTRSPISGSFATPCRMVLPFARVAAIIRFAVPVTVGLAKICTHPVKPLGAKAWMIPHPSTSISAPKASKPVIKSTNIFIFYSNAINGIWLSSVQVHFNWYFIDQFIPLMWRSTFRSPMLHPPGRGRDAPPNLAINGPSKTMEPRISLTSDQYL